MIIAIYNNKGGCGKTTITVNLAYELAVLGKKVCVIDLDGQSNTTSYLSEKSDDYSTFEAVINGSENIKNLIVKSDFKDVDVIRSSADMNLLEANFASDEYGTVEDVIQRLTKAKEDLSTYDYVLLDMPPSALNVTELLLNIFADKVIVPTLCTSDGIAGLGGVLNMVNPESVLCVLPSRVSRRNTIAQRHLKELKSALGGIVSDTYIQLSQAIENAPEEKKPARAYFYCKATSDFRKIAEKIIKIKS